MSTLPVVMLGMRWAGSCRTNSTFFSSSKRPLARILRHGDVHADEFALVVLEVPGRVRAAGAHDQLAAIEHRAQQAAGRRLRRRLLGRKRRCRSTCHAGHDQSCRTDLQEFASPFFVVHRGSPLAPICPETSREEPTRGLRTYETGCNVNAVTRKP